MADFSGRQRTQLVKRLAVLVILLAAAAAAVIFFIKKTGLIEQTMDRVSGMVSQAQKKAEYKDSPAFIVGERTAFSGDFTPFFPETMADVDALRMTQVMLLGNDKNGLIVEEGIDNYFYPGIANLKVSRQGEEIWYDITLLEFISFSDGVNLTADDVIFSMYVCCDPSYTGPYDMKQLPIRGMEEYVNGSAPSVSGIQKAGDYQVRVVMTQMDALAVYGLQIPVAPLHHYGDSTLYDYEKEQFGFSKGNLTMLHKEEQVGAGPYVFTGYEDGRADFVCNEAFYLGEPVTKHLALVDLSQAGGPEPDYTYESEAWEYHYIGINADRVNVGGNPGSDASMQLRRVLATAFTYARGLTTPMQNRAVNYPNPANTCLQINATAGKYQDSFFSLDADGKNLYTTLYKITDENGQEVNSSEAAMINSLKLRMQAAGLSPETALEYTLYIKTNAQGESDFLTLCKTAADYLAQAGITLKIQGVADRDSFTQLLADSEADLWCDTISITEKEYLPEADLSPYYLPEGPYNYYHINDSRLNELIPSQRSILDVDERMENYEQCLDIVLKWAVDIPLTADGHDGSYVYRLRDEIWTVEKDE